ncbi:MAG: P-loop NTPase [Thermoproteales archaeon]|nr:P-loop NTPase [Thermoproteales archaeon]
MSKVIAVAGGKGGTGKSLIAVSLAYILSLNNGKVLLVDADVENPCTYTLIPSYEISNVEITEFRPKINERCTLCGACVKLCPEHALMIIPNKSVILMENLCSGCSVCKIICPYNAIDEDHYITGWIKHMRSENDNLDMIVGELNPSSRRAVNMIINVIEYIGDKNLKYQYTVIDSPPGTGSGVYAILREANVTLAITEPTRLGLNDLEKFYLLYKKYGDIRNLLVVINKSSLKGGILEKVISFIEKNKLTYWMIPYDIKVVEAYSRGLPVVQLYPDISFSKVIKDIAYYISKEYE